MPKSNKVTFTDALRTMSVKSSNAKANDWGVEPHFDVLTSEQYIAYIFDNKREATSMVSELDDGRWVIVPKSWYPIINKHDKILSERKRYYAVYCMTLKIDLKDVEGYAINQHTVPHV